MFAVVKFSEEPRGFFKKLIFKFSQRKVFTEKVSIAPGVFFFMLTCSFTPDRADWDLIEECAGAAKSRIIFPENVSVPERFMRSSFEKLRKKAFIETALKILKNQKSECVTIDDREGFYINDIEKFVKLAPLIRVVTNNPERYDSVSEKIMEESGAALLICNENTDLGSTWLITYSGGVWHGDRIRAITAADICYGAEKLIRLFCLEFDDEYLELVPDGVNSEKFLSALYECSHAVFLENTLFDCDDACGT